MSYIDKVLERFNTDKAKVVSSSLAAHFKLNIRQSPSIDKEKKDMKNVPCTSAIGSLMYVMLCTKPDIAHVVGIVSHFLSNPRREHWKTVKWILRHL